jgi:hypothetical protein
MSAGDARDQAVAWRLAWTQASGGGAEAGAVGGQCLRQWRAAACGGLQQHQWCWAADLGDDGI